MLAKITRGARRFSAQKFPFADTVLSPAPCLKPSVQRLHNKNSLLSHANTAQAAIKTIATRDHIILAWTPVPYAQPPPTRPAVSPFRPRPARDAWQTDAAALRPCADQPKVRTTETARTSPGAAHIALHGLRCVRVGHGKGLGSPGKSPGLKSRGQAWLIQKNEVLAFVPAKPARGAAERR